MTKHLRTGAFVAAAALVLTTAFAGGAAAGQKIGGKQIAKNAIVSKHVKNGSLKLIDFKASEASKLVGPSGPAGQTGPQGSPGDAGSTGPAGPAGSTGPAGPAGPQGPAGILGFVNASGTAAVPAGTNGDVEVSCPNGTTYVSHWAVFMGDAQVPRSYHLGNGVFAAQNTALLNHDDTLLLVLTCAALSGARTPKDGPSASLVR